MTTSFQRRALVPLLSIALWAAVSARPAGALELRPQPAPRPAVASPDSTGPSRWNILLYVLDTTRADHLGIYGYERNTTPFLDSLLPVATLWRTFRSSGTWTWPSVVSILTSQTVETHRAFETAVTVHPAWPTLPAILEAHGYHTLLLTSNAVLDSHARTGSLFQEVMITERPDQRLTDRLARILRDPAARPFFIHAQPIAAHVPYIAPPPFDSLFVDDPFYGGLGDVPAINKNGSCEGGMKELAVIDDIRSMDWYVSQYDGLLAYMDDQIRQTFDVLEETGLRDSTIVVVTADHGEELAGEHNRYFCHSEHYDGNLRIPLLVVLPDGMGPAARAVRGLTIEGEAAQIDLMPTLLHLLGVPVPAGLQGRNLLETPSPTGTIAADHFGRSIVLDAQKLINRARRYGPDPNRELYDLGIDPSETRNLADLDPDRALALERTLLRTSRLAAAQSPPWEPTGPIYGTDFEDPGETDGRFELTYRGANLGWTFTTLDEPAGRVLSGVNTAGSSRLHYAWDAGFVGPPLADYRLDARLRLRGGKVAVEIAWLRVLNRGYRLVIEESRLTLERHGAGRDEVWGQTDYPYGLHVWRDLVFEHTGTEVRVFVDGELLLSHPETNPGELRGTTYFALASTGGACHIDDVRITRP